MRFRNILGKVLCCLFLLSFFVSGCAGRISTKMDSWMGHHKAELLDSWGPPQQTYEDGRGGEIYVYSWKKSARLPGRSDTKITTGYFGKITATTTYYPGQTITWKKYRMFWLDQNGIIYRWKWKGL